MGAIGLGVKPLDVVNLWMPRELFAPSPLAQIWDLGGTRFAAISTPVEIWRRGYKRVYARTARLHIRASSYSPPCQWVLNQPFKTRSGKHNPSIVPVVNLILRISNFGHHPYMMALNQVLDWKRYFAHSIRSDQWLGSTAGSFQDESYFSEHPTPFFRRNTSNLLA